MMNEHDELEQYPDGIFSKDAVVPRWLKLTYLTLPIWGVITFFIYWNGSHGWLDRGYWDQLQKAANTQYPMINLNDPNIDQQIKESIENQKSAEIQEKNNA